jgi:nitroreductase
MKKYTSAIEDLLLFVKFSLVKPPSTLSDAKLAPLLRSKVHNIEKGLVEGSNDLLSMTSARRLYCEAKKRNLLSQEEEKWCGRILFGQEAVSNDKLNSGSDREFMEIVENRRSVRIWENAALEENEFEHLLSAARWAPSSCNRQPLHFVLTKDKHKIKLLADVRGQKFIENSPNCIIVIANMTSYSEAEASYTPYLDAGAAIQNLLLMAHVLGLGACWVNFGPNEVNETNKEKVRTAFGIPKHYKIVSIIPIGCPKIVPIPPGRKDLHSILNVETFKER